MQRRDFTVNALYYDPIASEIVDFLGGMDDVRGRRLKAIIPLDKIFREDPVRMVRGIKYAAANHFNIPFSLKLTIRRDATLLSEVSPSRLAEEFYKIIASGKSVLMFQALDKYGLLQYMLPQVHAAMHRDKAFQKVFLQHLGSLDLLAQMPEDTSVLNSASAAEIVQSDRRLISPFLAWFIRQRLRDFAIKTDSPKEPSAFRLEAFLNVREFLAPLNLPRIALEEAMEQVLREDDLLPAPLPPKRRKRGPRRRKAKTRQEQAHAEVPEEPFGGAEDEHS